MPRYEFRRLLRVLGNDLVRNAQQASRSSGGVIQPAVRLGITLRILAGASYWDLCMLFRVGRSTVYDVFHDTIACIHEKIEMPGVPLTDDVELQRLADGFQKSREKPNPLYGCIGAIDGIAIKISKPCDEYVPRKFYCRKGFYALPVQAVVTSSYKFLYMSAMCAGSTHDSVAFALSSLGRKLKQGLMHAGYWIAGDAAYECRHSVITPWNKAQLMDEEEGLSRDAFNFYQSSHRMHVEQAFGMLVARFGILWKQLEFDLEHVPIILSVYMRLHNYCIDQKFPLIREGISAREHQSMQAAFKVWWDFSLEVQRYGTSTQGRRRDNEVSELRQAITESLKRNNVMRPRNTAR